MKFNPVPGIIYDSIVYNTIYFCKDIFFKMTRLYVENDQDVFLYYNKFCALNPLPTPDEDFYPFFFYDGTRPCALTKCFNKYYNCSIGTYDNFMQILNDKRQFKREVVYYFLEQYREEIDIEKVIEKDAVSISKAIVLLRSHGIYLDTFVRLFHDFDSVVDELSEYLKILFSRLTHFHKNHDQVIKDTLDNFLSPEVIKTYVKKAGIDKSIKVSDQTFSVSLLHPTALISQRVESKFFYILTTGAHEEVMRATDYNNVTGHSLSKIFANEIICDIIEELSKGDLTISKLSARLHVSRTTIDRLVNSLYSEFAINVCRTVGKEKYYKINPEFFWAAKSKSDTMFNELMSRWRCKNDKG